MYMSLSVLYSVFFIFYYVCCSECCEFYVHELPGPTNRLCGNVRELEKRREGQCGKIVVGGGGGRGLGWGMSTPVT